MSADKPTITVGMSTSEVIRLLGQPDQKMGGGDMMKMFASVSGSASAMSSLSSREYWVYHHPAGKYQLVIRGGMVDELYSHP